ncbi:Arc-like DNA binding dprotein [Ancylobacter aquaticus]|uniref:Arc-like DNA binding dprotein n=2 Tax=Ancylobacter aquaticus TaxID=100 RepID=A0A4R1I1F6_ANCAQ|nr:Arc-like DNA binding dprotein [Ancylobacter aquaticus]
MSREDLHFRLRIPEALKGRISASADANNRSMTAEMISRLETSFGPPQDMLLQALAALGDKLLEDEHIVELPAAAVQTLREAAEKRGLSMEDLVNRLVTKAAYHIGAKTDVGLELLRRIDKNTED